MKLLPEMKVMKLCVCVCVRVFLKDFSGFCNECFFFVSGGVVYKRHPKSALKQYVVVSS